MADTGPGFDADERQRLFEPFYRGQGALHIDASGLGIGLSIARGLVEAMGGHVWAHAQSDRGATFSFTLPVARVGESRPSDETGSAPTIEEWIEQALSSLHDHPEQN